MVSLDYVTPDTGYEPKDMELADTNELNSAASSDIYFQNTLEDTASFPNPDIPEFDSKWDGILLSMTKIPHDDILEGLYKLRIRESQKTKDRIGIVRPGDSS